MEKDSWGALDIISKLENIQIKAIPNSYEKFMSFTIGDLKFIDSFQFMASSLEKLTENLYDPEDKYKHYILNILMAHSNICQPQARLSLWE